MRHRLSRTLRSLAGTGAVLPPVRIGCCVLAAWLGSVAGLEATTIRLAWNPSPDPAVVGYMVSMGTESGRYTTHVDAGTQTIEQFSNLTPGTTYYFAVRAYDRAGNFSAYSNEVSGVAPATSPLAISCPAPVATSPKGRAVNVTFSAVASGGQPPIVTTCSPPSGALFEVGSTPVICMARDVVNEIVTCATAVVVVLAATPKEP